jgi:hypothetical protein
VNRFLALATAGFFWAAAAQAQHQPYSGQERRDIKALSSEQVKQYLDGAGMEYAKAAELNRYPGPLHTLELAEKIGLTPEQLAATRALMASHKAEAREIGKNLVDAERALDAVFRSGNAKQGELESAVRRTAQLEGDYRLSHLETHRRLRALLTDDQVARYEELRGYSGSSSHSGHGK